MNKRCQCGCYVPDRCHHCGEPLGDLRNESAELAMLRAENDLVKRERDSGIKSVFDLRRALAGQQAIINGRRTGLAERLREELAVYRGDWCMAAVVLVWVAITVAIVAAAIGRWAA